MTTMKQWTIQGLARLPLDNRLFFQDDLFVSHFHSSATSCSRVEQVKANPPFWITRLTGNVVFSMASSSAATCLPTIGCYLLCLPTY